MEEKAKDGEEIPMRAITMMKRNTNDDKAVYQLWKGAWMIMMKSKRRRKNKLFGR